MLRIVKLPLYKLDIRYYLTLQVRSHKQPLRFLLDTSNAWLWTQPYERKKCFKLRWTLIKYKKKKVFQHFSIKDVSITIKYGTGKVTGQLSNDQVSFGSMSKARAEAILFLYTTQVTGFEHMMPDGILHLATGIGITKHSEKFCLKSTLCNIKR